MAQAFGYDDDDKNEIAGEIYEVIWGARERGVPDGKIVEAIAGELYSLCHYQETEQEPT